MISIVRAYVLAWLHGDRNPHHPNCCTRHGNDGTCGRPCNCRGRGKPLIRRDTPDQPGV